MRKNIIFVFSGTGNSLKAAKDIADAVSDCEIVSMGNSTDYKLRGGYERIGFVFPVYFRGEPGIVREFISKLNLQNNQDAYYFAVATCGKYVGNALIHVKQLLRKKNMTLHYAVKLDMFSNYVVAYDMRDTIDEETKQSEKDFIPIIQSIKNKETNKLPATEPFQEIAYMVLSKFAPNMDKNYNISDACIGCGICKKVCPVDNISLGDDHKPYFKHHCEQCVACIQYCPQQAINYKNKTQNRKRYTNPSIKYADLAKFNNFV